MPKVKLGDLCLAIMNNGKIFRGARDDWGRGAESAYELLEETARKCPETVVLEVTTVGEFVDQICSFISSEETDGRDYLIEQLFDHHVVVHMTAPA